MLELKYFFCGIFKNPLPHPRHSLIESEKNNLPSNFDWHKEYLKTWSEFNIHKNNLHFYEVEKGNDKKLYLYCLPEHKSEIEDKLPCLYGSRFDSIHFYHSLCGNKNYNFWLNYPEQGPSFMLVIGYENMLAMYHRVRL